MSDPLPLRKKNAPHRWTKPQLAFVAAGIAVIYVFSTGIPGTGLYYNDRGHKAYDRDDFTTAKRYHLAAIALVPNHPLFLDNLGMVYLQQFTEKKDPNLLASAKTYFQRAVEASPQSLDPYIHMEAVLVRSLNGIPEHDFEINQAIIRSNTALLNVDPYIPFARKNLASAYYNAGQVDRAF